VPPVIVIGPSVPSRPLVPRPMPAPSLPPVASTLPPVMPTNDPWWDDWNIFQWHNHQWGPDAINIPAAWSSYGGYFRDIKVGDVDDGFRNNHEDLQIPDSNVMNRGAAPNANDDSSHGTHTLGTIAAIHNNSKGLSGVMDISRDSVYAYNCFSGGNAADADILAGLAWTVTHGAKVINFSLGEPARNGDPVPERLYTRGLQKLLNQGYDFVISQSVGNSAINTFKTGAFRSVVDADLT
jgi:subtilisin family serine protease